MRVWPKLSQDYMILPHTRSLCRLLGASTTVVSHRLVISRVLDLVGATFAHLLLRLLEEQADRQGCGYDVEKDKYSFFASVRVVRG